MEQEPEPIKIKKGNKYTFTTFEQSVYKKVVKTRNPLNEISNIIKLRATKLKNRQIIDEEKTPNKNKRKKQFTLNTKHKKRRIK